MMRTLLLLSTLAVALALLAPSAVARPSPVGLYPCFNGGTTVVVNGETVLTCFQGVEVTRCTANTGVEVRVMGEVVYTQCRFGPPPP